LNAVFKYVCILALQGRIVAAPAADDTSIAQLS